MWPGDKISSLYFSRQSSNSPNCETSFTEQTYISKVLLLNERVYNYAGKNGKVRIVDAFYIQYELISIAYKKENNKIHVKTYSVHTVIIHVHCNTLYTVQLLKSKRAGK